MHHLTTSRAGDAGWEQPLGGRPQAPSRLWLPAGRRGAAVCCAVLPQLARALPDGEPGPQSASLPAAPAQKSARLAACVLC